MNNMQQSDKKQISYRLCKAKLDSGKTYRQINEETDISVNALSGYVSNGVMPTASNLARLCRCLGVSADWVLGLEEDENGPGT